MCGGAIGKTQLPSVLWGLSPRVRGSRLTKGSVKHVGGLSPRVRGSLEHTVLCCVLTGSIPACAGEPSQKRMRLRPHRVYPRVCGGASIKCPASAVLPGLSPRVRGSLLWRKTETSKTGSIPACAGEPERCHKLGA